MLGAGTVFRHPNLSAGLILLNKEQYRQDKASDRSPRQGLQWGEGKLKPGLFIKLFLFGFPKQKPTRRHSHALSDTWWGVGMGAPENPVLSLMNSVPKIKPANPASSWHLLSAVSAEPGSCPKQLFPGYNFHRNSGVCLAGDVFYNWKENNEKALEQRTFRFSPTIRGQG